MKKVGGSILGAAGLIAVLTLLSRVMGLVRKLAQSWAMSDGAVATAYDTANTVPNVLFEVAAGGALAGAVIPLLSRFLAKKMQAEASQTASALLTWILVIALPIAGIVALGADAIVGLLFSDAADPAIVSLAGTFLRMFALQVPLYGMSVVLTGILQAHKKFFLPAVSPLLSSIVVTGAFAWYALSVGPEMPPEELTTQAVYVIGWGTTLGVVAFSLPQLIPAARLLRLRPTLSFPPGVARHAMRLVGAGLGALVAQQVAIVAIMYTANALGGVGTYAAYNYAYAIFMVPYAVLAVPIATAIFPRISEAAGLEDRAGLAGLVSRSTRLVLAAGIICVALLVALAEPAAIVLEAGRTIEGLAIGMRAMAVGLVGFSLLYHVARVLYAVDAGRRVITTNTLGWGTVCVGLAVAHVAGVEGRVPTLVAIGVALSVGLSVGALAAVLAVRTEVGDDAVAGFARITGLLSLAMVAFGAIGWLVVNLVLDWLGRGMIGAFAAAIVGAIVIIGGGVAALWAIDRKALRAVR